MSQPNHEFDKAAWGYNFFMRSWGLFKDRAIIQALGLTGVETVVDLGGGTGHYAALLAGSCRKVTVVDESKRMLARAPRLENVETLQADIRDTGLPAHTFDVALLLDVLHHVPEPARALAEAHRLLKKNGRIMVMEFAASDIRTRLAGFLERRFLGPVTYFDPRELIELLEDSGFTQVRLMQPGLCYIVGGSAG